MHELLHQYLDFNLMGEHFGEVFEAFLQTLLLFAVSAVFALVWGLILALLRQLPARSALPVRFLTITYIDVFRAIPVLMIILLVSGSLPYLEFLPKSVRIPEWLGESDPFWYGTLSLTIVYGAYMAEVYRAGIEAVPRGQMEAARSLGMSHGQAMRNVVVPQAVRKVLAPMLNELSSLLKETTLVSVIAFNEVALIGRNIQSATFNSSALTLGAFMFLIVVLPMARIVDKLIARNQQKITRGSHIEVA